MRNLCSSLLVLSALAPRCAAAQPSQPPIQQLRRVVATSTMPLVTVGGIRVLSDSFVLVNDVLGRRVVLLDANLRFVRTVLDSTMGITNSYGADAGGLFAWPGDSSAFVPSESGAMLILSPDGRVARVLALPPDVNPGDLTRIGATSAAFDAAGRLVLRNTYGADIKAYDPNDPNAPMPGDGLGFAPLMRVDLTSHHADTLALLLMSRPSHEITYAEGRIQSIHSTINPLPTTDDWALMPDGSVMVVRGRDFHTEHVRGAHDATVFPKIPFAWEPLTLEQRQAVVDSAQRKMASTMAMMPQLKDPRMRSRLPVIEFTAADRLPPYHPAFYAGMTRADPGGRIWIRTSFDPNDGPVYDVVDTSGVLVERVRLPKGRVLLAVGPDGVVYMAMNDLMGMAHLEKALRH